MKKNVIKLATIVCATVMMFSVPVYASPNVIKSVYTDVNSANFGVGFEEPSKDLRDISSPTTTWDISKSGTYNFYGEAERSTLYTNYKFKGKTSYTITVKNKHATKTLKVKCSGSLTSTKVKPGKTETIKITKKNASETFYISFSAPSNFSGTVN